ncbi:hypothetical protein Tco_0970310 [Tanacetum coccineum]
MFHVSNLKKCMTDKHVAIPLDEIQIDDKLHFIEELVEIMDREVKRLKQSRIPIVKVRWNPRRGSEFTWECEDQMQKNYPYLFPIFDPVADATSLVSRAKVIENQVMAISVISVSSDSSKESVGTSTGFTSLYIRLRPKPLPLERFWDFAPKVTFSSIWVAMGIVFVLETAPALPSSLKCGLISTPEEMRHAWFLASVEFIKGLADQDGNFFQDDLGGENVFQSDEAVENCIEHHNGFGGHTEDGNFVEGLDETMGEKEETDLNPKHSEEIPNFCFDPKDTSNHTAGVSTDPMLASSSSHPGNEEVAYHADNRMEINTENAKDDYTNYQHYLHLLIKACTFKTEIPTIDVLVPPNDHGRLLPTMKLYVACDQVDVDHFADDYMLMLNDEEKPVNSSLDDMELEQQPDNVVDKEPHVEQQPNDAKAKTAVLKEIFEVKVDENFVSAEQRKKKLVKALKPPFHHQSATTPASNKTRSRSMNTDVITPPIFVKNLSRPDDCKRDKVTIPNYKRNFLKIKDLPKYRLPRGKRDIVVGRRFWLSLASLDIGYHFWLQDYVRPLEADVSLCIDMKSYPIE